MRKYRIGVISDTHGLLREEALEVLKGSDLIIHAGDVCKIEVLEELRNIGQVYCVRGNNDKGELGELLPKDEVIEVGGVIIYVLHDINHLDLDPEAAGFRVVITGHSHKPSISTKGNVLYFNPGSAGPRRFDLPITLGFLNIDGEKVYGNIVEL